MKDNGGFTLIEVLIAMVVLSVALLELGRMQLVAMQVNANAQNLTEATYLGQDVMERLMALPFNDASLTDTSPNDEGVWTTYTALDPPAGYTISWAVNQVRNPLLHTDVTITVSWQAHGVTKNSKFSFIKSSVR